jgi:hypothetical protein
MLLETGNNFLRRLKKVILVINHQREISDKTIYRDQINKVANAIKEIISGLRTGEVLSGKEKIESRMPWEEIKKEKRITGQERPAGFNKRKLLSGIIVAAVLLGIAAILIYPKLFKRDTLGNLRSSREIVVVVMPFENLTNDTTWNVWQKPIQEILTNSLTNSEELTVRQT